MPSRSKSRGKTPKKRGRAKSKTRTPAKRGKGKGRAKSKTRTPAKRGKGKGRAKSKTRTPAKRGKGRGRSRSQTRKSRMATMPGENVRKKIANTPLLENFSWDDAIEIETGPVFTGNVATRLGLGWYNHISYKVPRGTKFAFMQKYKTGGGTRHVIEHEYVKQATDRVKEDVKREKKWLVFYVPHGNYRLSDTSCKNAEVLIIDLDAGNSFSMFLERKKKDGSCPTDDSKADFDVMNAINAHAKLGNSENGVTRDSLIDVQAKYEKSNELSTGTGGQGSPEVVAGVASLLF